MGTVCDYRTNFDLRLVPVSKIPVFFLLGKWDLLTVPSGAVALMDAITKARPSGAKGNFIKHITVASTMGPGVKVDPNEHVKGVE